MQNTGSPRGGLKERDLGCKFKFPFYKLSIIMVMTSTQVDEEAQHFYRKPGYKDCGCLTIDIPGYEQPMEMFMSKRL